MPIAELLHAAGILDNHLLQLMKSVPLEFVARRAAAQAPLYIDRKAINAVRIELAQMRTHMGSTTSTDWTWRLTVPLTVVCRKMSHGFCVNSRRRISWPRTGS